MPTLLQRLWRSRTQRVMSITAVGMVVALLADVLIAVRLGAQGATDALIIAITLPRLLGNVGREATKFSLMTVFIHVDQRAGDAAMRDLARRTLNLFLLIGLLFVAAALLFADALAALIGPGLDAAHRAEAAHLLRLAAPMGLFTLGSAVVEVALNSRKQFTVTAWRNTLAPLAVVGVIAGTWQMDHPGPWIALGYSAGYGLLFAFMLHYSFHRLGIGLNPGRWPTRATLRELRGSVSFPLAGFSVRQSARVAERAIASLAPAGGVAAYYFAFRLLASVQNLVGVSIALTGQPRLTEHDLAGDAKRFNRLLLRRVGYSLAVSVPLAAGLALLHERVVAVLFGYGRFGPEAVAATGRVLLVLALGLPFICALPVLNSGLYARKRFGAVLYNMCFAAAANVALAWWFFQAMGLPGVALGSVGAAVLAVVNLSVLLFVFGRRPAPADTASPLPDTAPGTPGSAPGSAR